jgi:hypothetical protein
MVMPNACDLSLLHWHVWYHMYEMKCEIKQTQDMNSWVKFQILQDAKIILFFIQSYTLYTKKARMCIQTQSRHLKHLL